MRVCGGLNPISGKRNYLTDIIPAGKDAAGLAEKARTRLLSQVDERRNPRSKVTVNQLMDRYLDLLDVDVTTLACRPCHLPASACWATAEPLISGLCRSLSVC